MSDTAPRYAAESNEALMKQFGLTFNPDDAFYEARLPLERVTAAQKLVDVLKKFTGLDPEDTSREAHKDRQVALPFADGTVLGITGTLTIWPTERSEPSAAQVILAHTTSEGRHLGNTRSYTHRGYKRSARVEKDVDGNRWSVFDGEIDQLGRFLVFASEHDSR